MKKVLILIGIGLIAWSCTDVKKTEEYQELKAQNDSLTNITVGQSSEIFNYLTEFNDIQENLNEIKRRENIINVNRVNANETDNQDRIKEDINTIYELLKENKQKLNSLNHKYKKSSSKNEELSKLINSLNDQIGLKDQEIIVLNNELQMLNIEVQDLNTENDMLSGIVDTLDDALHTAYYVVGTSKELKEHNIINRTGGFLGIGRSSELDANFDKTYFEEINTLKFNKIAIYSKKIRIVTTHPEDSYEIEGAKNKVDNLIIKDADKFWSASKILVIEVTK